MPVEVFYLEMDKEEVHKKKEQVQSKSLWLIETEKKVNDLIFAHLLDEYGKANVLMKNLKKFLISREKQRLSTIFESNYSVESIADDRDKITSSNTSEGTDMFDIQSAIYNFGLEVEEVKEKIECFVNKTDKKAKKIKKLNFGYNKINFIPPEIKNMINVIDIDVSILFCC